MLFLLINKNMSVVVGDETRFMTDHKRGGIMISLRQKMQALRDELDNCRELYEERCHQLEIEKQQRNTVETESEILARRVCIMEYNNEQLEKRLELTVERLQEALKIIDDEYELSKRSQDYRENLDEDKILTLEKRLAESKMAAAAAERKYDEITRRLLVMELELTRAEERADAAEGRVHQLSADADMMAANLRAVEINKELWSSQEESYEMSIKSLNSHLRDADYRIESLSKELKVKQLVLDRTEDELMDTKLRYSALREEMDSCLRHLGAI